jgi:hypothetical protein
MDANEVLHRIRVAQLTQINGWGLITMLDELNCYQREVRIGHLFRRIARYRLVSFPFTLGWRAPFFVVAPAVRWQLKLMTRGVKLLETHEENYADYTFYLGTGNTVGATCMFAVRPAGERTTLLNLALYWPCVSGLPEPFTLDGYKDGADAMRPFMMTLKGIDQAVIESVQSERADSEEAIRIKPPLPRYTSRDDWPIIFWWVRMYEPKLSNSELARRLGVAVSTVSNARNLLNWHTQSRGGWEIK